MEIPKTYTFTSKSFEGTFKKGDCLQVDTTPRASYHGLFVLVYIDKKFKPYHYKELKNGKVVLFPYNLRGRLLMGDNEKFKPHGVLVQTPKTQ